MERREQTVSKLLDEGLSGAEIARRMGVSHSTVSRIAARSGRRLGAPRESRFDWPSIRAYYEEGRTIADCCRRFGFSRGAWDRAVTRGNVVPRPPAIPPPSETRQAVGSLLAKGRTQAAIAVELGLSKATIAHHARGLGIAPDKRFSRRYDWPEIQRAHDSGLTARQCCAKFGFATATWSKAVQTGRLTPREYRIPLEQLLVRGRRTSRGHLKQRLIKAGLKENRCEECAITEWRGMPFNMHLHHINGDGQDNRLENIAFLCGNCHAQTDTYGGRNGHRKPKPHLELVEAPEDDGEEVA